MVCRLHHDIVDRNGLRGRSALCQQMYTNVKLNYNNNNNNITEEWVVNRNSKIGKINVCIQTPTVLEQLIKHIIKQRS